MTTATDCPRCGEAKRTLERVRALPRNWLSIRCGVRSPGLRAAAESLRLALRTPPDE